MKEQLEKNAEKGKIEKSKKTKLDPKPANSKKILLDVLKKVLFFVVGSCIYAAGIALFLGPQQTPSGGASGLAIIINHLLPIFKGEDGGTGIWLLMINVPLLILSFFKLGKRFSAITVVIVSMTSFFTEFFEKIYDKLTPINSLDTLPAVIIGGICSGFAIGLIFKGGACLGGSDIVVKVLRLKFPYMKTGTFFLIIDGAIVLLGGLVFQDINKLVYAIIALFIQSKVTDLVLYGQDGAKMIYIITENMPEIAGRITKELHSGVTYLHAHGAYTGAEKEVLMCAMRKQLLPQAKDIVLEEDPKAFMIVTSATQVWGSGYKRLDEKEL